MHTISSPASLFMTSWGELLNINNHVLNSNHELNYTRTSTIIVVVLVVVCTYLSL